MYTPGMRREQTNLASFSSSLRDDKKVPYKQTRARVWSRVPFVSSYVVLLRQSKAAYRSSSFSLCYSQVFSICDRTFAVCSPFTQPVLLSLPLVLRSSDQDTGVLPRNEKFCTVLAVTPCSSDCSCIGGRAEARISFSIFILRRLLFI